jgi:hypothetical protein
MSKPLVTATTSPDPYSWRAGTGRILANALLVLLAYEVVSLLVAIPALIAGESPRVTPVELVLLVSAYVLIRWVFVLPALLAVLAGIEWVARRIPHARILTTVVAFAPMVLWELTNTPGPFPSPKGAVLGGTAVLFAVLARLPARRQGRVTNDHGPAQPPAEAAVAPREPGDPA